MKISLLIMNAYGMGGTVRATANLAEELARTHHVEIVSVLRHRDTPFLPLSRRVGLSTLVDLRPAAVNRWQRARGSGRRRRLSRPSMLTHPQERAFSAFSAETDLALRRYLRRPETDVLVTTRPVLNILSARFAPAGVLRIGQEHLHFGAHKPGLLDEIRTWYPRLDALVTLTEADRTDYHAMLAATGTQVHAIGNGLPAGPHPRSPLTGKVVLAAGRLVPVKGYDRLLEAFAKVVEKRPDWTLRIYGDGIRRAALTARATELGLDGNVTFMGATGDIDGALAGASIHVVTSRFEGFGMTIVEAFACGVPVVSFDCPRGPREIITSGEDGLLVPDGDLDAFADALLSLIDDPDGLARMARGAHRSAARYDIAAVAGRWERLLTGLT
jgi:glycosyltransferase involved in cell wall biosynthesis